MALLRAGQPAVASPDDNKEVPTLAEFWPRFIDGQCRANRHKPSGIEGKESVYRVHLARRFGSRRLDSLRNEDIQQLKADMATKGAKTVNNVLTALSKCLKVAVEWDVMERVPCTVRLLKVTSSVPGWYEILAYERLVEAAQRIDPRIHIMVLLAGSAGMCRGEILAVKWSELDLKRRLIHVQRSIWEGHETVPKGGKGRVVDMTSSLADALRHLRGDRVLYADDGRALTNKIVRFDVPALSARDGLLASPPASPGADLVRGDILETEKIHVVRATYGRFGRHARRARRCLDDQRSRRHGSPIGTGRRPAHPSRGRRAGRPRYHVRRGH